LKGSFFGDETLSEPESEEEEVTDDEEAGDSSDEGFLESPLMVTEDSVEDLRWSGGGDLLSVDDVRVVRNTFAGDCFLVGTPPSEEELEESSSESLSSDDDDAGSATSAGAILV